MLRAAERAAVPWLNGGGLTAEVLRRPAAADTGGFGWRLSIATVDGDGVFSRYPGVDRVLLPLSAGGLDLRDGERLVHLARFEAYRFAGEGTVSSANVTQPTLDLNLMTRRGSWAGTLESLEVRKDWTAATGRHDELAFVVLEGSLRVGGHVLTAQDAVLVEAGGRVSAHGTARVALARVSRRH